MSISKSMVVNTASEYELRITVMPISSRNSTFQKRFFDLGSYICDIGFCFAYLLLIWYVVNSPLRLAKQLSLSAGGSASYSGCRWLRFSPGEHSGEHLPWYVIAEGSPSPTVFIPTKWHEMKQHVLHLHEMNTCNIEPPEYYFFPSFFPDWIL